MHVVFRQVQRRDTSHEIFQKALIRHFRIQDFVRVPSPAYSRSIKKPGGWKFPGQLYFVGNDHHGQYPSSARDLMILLLPDFLSSIWLHWSCPRHTIGGIRLLLLVLWFHWLPIGDVQRHILINSILVSVQYPKTHCLMSALCQFVYHIMSQLSGNACHEYFHIYMPFFISLFSHTFLYSNFDTLRL